MSKIEMDKKYRTRHSRGGPVRLLCTDRIHPTGQVVVALESNETIFTTTSDGISSYGPDYDLIEVKPRIKHTMWVNVYKNWVGDLYHSKDAANRDTGDHRIACVKVEIDCEEGEGLS